MPVCPRAREHGGWEVGNGCMHALWAETPGTAPPPAVTQCWEGGHHIASTTNGRARRRPHHNSRACRRRIRSTALRTCLSKFCRWHKLARTPWCKCSPLLDDALGKNEGLNVPTIGATGMIGDRGHRNTGMPLPASCHLASALRPAHRCQYAGSQRLVHCCPPTCIARSVPASAPEAAI
jgi:hypothetical protein